MMDEPEDKPQPFDDEEAEAHDKPEAPDDGAPPGPLSSAEFHGIAQKQIMNAVFAVLAETKMDWVLVAPFLQAARELCIGDFEETGRVRLHTTRAEGSEWIEAEEAFLGISICDRDDGEEWLSETYWLSDVAIADGDPAEVRRIARGLERSLAKINLWLADKPPEAPDKA